MLNNFLYISDFCVVPPPGSRELFTDLLHSLVPSFHPLAASLGLLNSYLISGSEGSGKRELVKSLAEECGVHFIEVLYID